MQPESEQSEADSVLYKKGDVTVTPSWLNIGGTSYATRYLQKLVPKTSNPPRTGAGILCFFAFVLTLMQAYRIFNEPPLLVLNWVLLGLCVLLLVSAYLAAFAITKSFYLEVHLAIESEPLKIKGSSEADLKHLQEQLARTMDWHRNDAEKMRVSEGEALESKVRKETENLS